MSRKHIMPMTQLGKWGFGLICLAVALVVLSMLTARLLSSPEANTAYNLIGFFAPAFVAVTIVALVISWIAILKNKDRGILFVIFASVLTLITLLVFVGEVIESSWSGN